MSWVPVVASVELRQVKAGRPAHRHVQKLPHNRDVLRNDSRPGHQEAGGRLVQLVQHI